MEGISAFEITIYVLAGIITAIVNTLAGSGTIFSFGALLYLGVPIDLANTTNRIGVFFQNVTAIITFRSYGKYSLRNLKLQYVIPTLAGAMIGAFAAINVSERFLDIVAGIAMVILLFDAIFDFKKYIKNMHWFNTHTPWISVLLFFIIGLYGGFIQIGIGIMVVFAIHLVSDSDLVESNFLKLIIILVYTVPTTIYFIYQGKIIWVPALALTVGQIIGAIAAGIFSNVSTNAGFWIRRLLVLMILATLIKVLL